MNKHDTVEVRKLIHSIGLMYNLTDQQARDIVESQFRFIRESITKVGLNDMLEEDLPKAKTNYILRHLGKIHTSEKRIMNIKKRKKEYKDGINQQDEHCGSNE